MKMYQAVQKLLMWDTQTDRQTGDIIRLLAFLGSRVKMSTIFSKTSIYTLYVCSVQIVKYFWVYDGNSLFETVFQFLQASCVIQKVTTKRSLAE
jgi:hypothetical protein